MKELVEMIAKSLVADTDQVQVSQLDGEQSSIIELKVAPGDLGKATPDAFESSDTGTDI